MTATETTKATRVQTVYYVVKNGEQVAQASRPQAAKAKFAEIVAEDTTSHIVLTTGKGKVLDERPAAEVATETVTIPGLGELTQDDLATLANVGAELKAVREAQAARTDQADDTDGDINDVLAGLADALNIEAETTEAPASEETTQVEVQVTEPTDTAEVAALKVEIMDMALTSAEARQAREAQAKETKPATTTGPTRVASASSTLERMMADFQNAVNTNQMGAGSLAGYKAGVRAVLRTLEGGLDTDLTKVDVEVALAVFEAKTPTLIDQTRKTYAADFRRAVTIWNLYLADPKNFKFPAKNVRATRLVAPAAPAAPTAPAPAAPAARTAKKSSKKNK